METTKTKVNKTKFDEVYGLDYFYENYNRKYSPALFGEKGIRKKKIDKLLYSKILTEYLDIYFKEVYFLNTNMYFLYTGMFRLVLYRPRVIVNRKVKKFIEASIGFYWYQRPSQLYSFLVRIIRLTGKRNRIPKIEKIYKNNFDINLIANFEDVIRKETANKNQFINK